MALLDLVQEFCKRRGLPVPMTAIGNTDDTVVQLVALLNEGIAEITDRYEWPVLQIRYTFHHRNTPAGDTVALDVRELNQNLPDFRYMLNYTLWDDTSKRQVVGPLSPREWEQLILLNISQALYHYSWFGRDLRIYPIPTSVATTPFSLVYLTRYAVQDPVNAGGPETYKAQFSLDTDLSRFPSNIMLADLKWRWGQAKGLPYAEDFRTCEGMLVNYMGRQPAPDLDMGANGDYDWRPGIFVPAGSWPL